MRRHGERVLLSPSDLDVFLGCRHASALDFRADVLGESLDRAPRDEGAAIVMRRGGEHERRHLAAIRERVTGEVVEIPRGDLDGSVARTVAAMRHGAALIYQGVLADGGSWHGYPDFLVRVEVPSALGSWSYEVHDTKLARSLKATFAVQLAVYADLVAEVQGEPPPALRVMLGDGGAAALRPQDVVHYVRRAKRRLEAAVHRTGPHDPGPVTVAEPCAACPECAWRKRCEAEWQAADHLQAVAGIRRSQIGKLATHGIATMADLAAAGPGLRVPGIDPAVLDQLRAQAALQVAVRDKPDERKLELLDPGPGRGLARLPPPDPADLFFDMEGDPLFPDGGLEYLFGIHGEGGFRAFWAYDRAGERAAFEAFMDHVVAVTRAHPDAHIYHYNHYETTALKRLAMTHGTREAELDTLLREGRFVDLYVVVREAMRTSEPGLSLKNVERFYRDARDGEVGTAADSIVAFERWLALGDDTILAGIEAYNRDDCVSTQELRDWLVGLRPAGMAWSRRPEPSAAEQDAAAKRAAEESEADALRAALVAGVGEDERPHRELLAQLCGFHRREQKPEWWAMFDRMTQETDELIEDLACLGGLEAIGDPVPEKRSLVQTYRFPPQDTKLKAGDGVTDAATGRACGKLRELDLDAGTAKLGWGQDKEPLPRNLSLGPGAPLDERNLRAAVARIARSVRDADGAYAAAEAILRRDLPRRTDLPVGSPLRGAGQTALDAVLATCRTLDGSYVVIQGPPGTGKTWTSAQLILDALAQGRSVGVTALSHKAINNVLAAVEDAAAKAGLALRGAKRSNKDQPESRLNGTAIVDLFDDPEPGAYPLVGATVFAWAKPTQQHAVDLMVVDEAGQVSLANLLALATAARNVVLVGDQMQLGQPIRGVHPGGSGSSALEHLLGDQAVVPPERGIFLDETRRMHPAICRFVSDAFYDGRLTAHPSCAEQRLILGEHAHPALRPTGLVYLPVEHEACTQRSDDEIAVLCHLWTDLVEQRWRDAHGRVRQLTQDDVLIVTPWNVQVNAIRQALPNARVGTVDRFQGQEAPVVLVSMATSGTDPIPRGHAFLFARERLNVALSRARCLAVVLASPRLLEVPCATVDELRLVDTLCRVAEDAAVAPGSREAAAGT